MRKSFFKTSEITSKKRVPLTPRCGMCGLGKDNLYSRIPVYGHGKKKILFISDQPRKNNDDVYRHKLKNACRKAGLNLKKDCWLTYSIICRPDKDAKPSDEQIKCCRPNIMKAIKQYKPNVIVLLGSSAIESLLGYLWKERTGGVTKWAGWCIPNHQPNTWIIPTFHPSYVLEKKHDVVSKMFVDHIKLAVKKSTYKPWHTIPDYKSEIEIIKRPKEAATLIEEMAELNRPIAFDYESNCLKSQTKGAKLVSCSICWNGEKTIAYPWEREAIDATSLILKSKDVPKIAQNLKFENNWTKTILGHNVRNWYFDTMLAAHVLDNRKGITSIKFQGFVQLGQQRYDDHIKPYLNGKIGLNRIEELDLDDILLYNGMDSLLTYKVAMIQMKQLMKRKII